MQRTWSSVPSTYSKRLITTCNSRSGGPDSFFWPPKVPVYMYTYMCSLWNDPSVHCEDVLLPCQWQGRTFGADKKTRVSGSGGDTMRDRVSRMGRM